MTDTVLITSIFSLASVIVGAALGIAGTLMLEKRKEKKAYSAFLLEFTLQINWLNNHINDLKKLMERPNKNIITEGVIPLVQNPIYHRYDLISQIQGIDIEEYYEMILELEKIDEQIKHPYQFSTGTSPMSFNPLIFTTLKDFDTTYLEELQNLLERKEILLKR